MKNCHCSHQNITLQHILANLNQGKESQQGISSHYSILKNYTQQAQLACDAQRRPNREKTVIAVECCFLWTERCQIFRRQILDLNWNLNWVIKLSLNCFRAEHAIFYCHLSDLGFLDGSIFMRKLCRFNMAFNEGGIVH